MAVLSGLTQNSVAYVSAATPTPSAASGKGSQPTTAMPAVIDGTPVRVVVLALSAAAGLMAMHAAGFRFNVAVSG